MNDFQAHLMAWLAEKFVIAAPQAAAEALQNLATHEALALLKPLKAEQVIEVANRMEPVKAAAVLRRLPSRQAAYVLARLNLPQASAIYKSFSQPQQEKMKALLEPSVVQALAQASDWQTGSAGALMKRDFVSFKTENKVSEIVEKLKNWPRKKFPTACVIVNKEGQFKGLIRTAELAFYAPQSVAGSVMGSAAVLTAHKPAQEALALLQQGQVLVPVLDEKQVVLGVLSWAELVTCEDKKKRFKWF